ncbi:MAG: DUF349 domain-containing protein [Bacteroidales bacterium]|jgi:hypothetical protein|nr:DUF349 domain-containing protein [Bacteroidales bacterium]
MEEKSINPTEQEIAATQSEQKSEQSPMPEQSEQSEQSAETIEQIEQSEQNENRIDETELSTLSREDIVEKLRSFITEGNLKSQTPVISQLKLRYRELTAELRQEAYNSYNEIEGEKGEFIFEDSTETTFREVNEQIKTILKKEREDLEKLMEENLVKKKALLDELRSLVDSDLPLKTMYDSFKELSEKWKSIHPVSRLVNNDLWSSYQFLTDRFFDKVKMNVELRNLDYKKNLEEKIKLCEDAEALLLEENINKASSALHRLHERWKETGSVAPEKRDEIWERFKAVSDAIAQKRKQAEEEFAEQRQQNLLAKQALCEKMEALADNYSSVKEWNEKTSEADELMKIWKSIGRAPEKLNDEVWERFRSAMNNFYENKKNYFQSLTEERKRNYEQKFDIVIKAELIAQKREDWRKATVELKELQRQWKEIGPVPDKQSQKIWERFRAACDEFFNQKKIIYEQQHANENDNLNAKKALIEEVKTLNPKEDKDAFIAAIKDIQRRWTEIGFVPADEKENVYKEFRSEIDAKFAQLGSDRPKRWIDTIENAETLSSRDMQILLNKIQTLRADVLTWENNMGFLSRSKNADVLKKEFEVKIQKAKEELALMEAKLKMLRAANPNMNTSRSNSVGISISVGVGGNKNSGNKNSGNKNSIISKPKLKSDNSE